MDFLIDPDTQAIAEAVLRFVEREVLPLQQRHHDLLGSERTLFDTSGRYVPEALALRQQVRKRSAELGFYTLFGDEKLGGGGQGAQVMAHVQEMLNHRVGPAQPLVQTVVLPSPFTNGLSPVLRHLKPDYLCSLPRRHRQRRQDPVFRPERARCRLRRIRHENPRRARR